MDLWLPRWIPGGRPTTGAARRGRGVHDGAVLGRRWRERNRCVGHHLWQSAQVQDGGKEGKEAR